MNVIEWEFLKNLRDTTLKHSTRKERGREMKKEDWKEIEKMFEDLREEKTRKETKKEILGKVINIAFLIFMITMIVITLRWFALDRNRAINNCMSNGWSYDYCVSHL